MRYTPQSKPLPQADYPVKNILPDVYTQRRVNRGFENVGLSVDGKIAWVTLQSPMGDGPDEKNSCVIRTLKLDVTDPLDAKVVGEYLSVDSDYKDYPQSPTQTDLKISDTTWINGDKLLVLERAKGLMKLFA